MYFKSKDIIIDCWGGKPLFWWKALVTWLLSQPWPMIIFLFSFHVRWTYYSMAQGAYTNELRDFCGIHMAVDRMGFSVATGTIRHITENSTAMMTNTWEMKVLYSRERNWCSLTILLLPNVLHLPAPTHLKQYKASRERTVQHDWLFSYFSWKSIT